MHTADLLPKCIIHMLKDCIPHHIISYLKILEMMLVLFSRELIKYISRWQYGGIGCCIL